MQSKSFLCVALLGLIVSLALGADTPNPERDGLTGINEIAVVAEKLSDAAKNKGFDDDSFKTQVELRLRHSSVKIKDNAQQYLHFCITVIPLEGQRLVVYSISISFRQMAKLDANNKSMFVTTWHRGYLGIGNLQDTKDSLDELVDDFINDYLAANQK